MKPTDEYKICSLEEAEEFAQKRMENAYELADWLYFWCEGKQYPKENLLIVGMLRQQADEIQGLKDGFNTAWGGTNNSELAEVRAFANRKILEVKAQADRIAELENQLDKCSHHEAMAHQGGYEIGYAEGLKKAREK